MTLADKRLSMARLGLGNLQTSPVATTITILGQPGPIGPPGQSIIGPTGPAGAAGVDGDVLIISIMDGGSPTSRTAANIIDGGAP